MTHIEQFRENTINEIILLKDKAIQLGFKWNNELRFNSLPTEDLIDYLYDLEEFIYYKEYGADYE